MKPKTPVEIAAEIAALKALTPCGPFAEKTRKSISIAVEELEHGFDTTSGEWDELSHTLQDIVTQTRDWKEGWEIIDAPSTGWGKLVEQHA